MGFTYKVKAVKPKEKVPEKKEKDETFQEVLKEMVEKEEKKNKDWKDEAIDTYASMESRQEMLRKLYSKADGLDLGMDMLEIGCIF